MISCCLHTHLQTCVLVMHVCACPYLHTASCSWASTGFLIISKSNILSLKICVLQWISSRKWHDVAASPRLTCMLCWGCSTRDWLSPVGGLLELLVRARGCGLSTKNGGWVPSVKCRSISELFFSWRVCVMSNSRTTVYRAQKTTEKQPKKNWDQFHRMSEHCWLMLLDFSDRPP